MQAKHTAEGCVSWGVNGETGEIADMTEYGVWEAYSVKAQTYKTAIEVCFISCFVLLVCHCLLFSVIYYNPPQVGKAGECGGYSAEHLYISQYVGLCLCVCMCVTTLYGGMS